MPAVLITGGSEGIGYALAECFAKDGMQIILAAKDMMKLTDAVHRLQNAYHVKIRAASIDLSIPGSAQQLYEKYKDEEIDILINCAGIGYTRRSWDIPAEDDHSLIGVNVTALMDLTKLYLKDMCQRGRGTILNVASTGAFQPGPYIASYYASKAFVLNYTRAAAEEARPYGVHVQCLCPGPVDTSFYAKSGVRRPRYAMSAEKCARYAYQRLGKKKQVLVPGFFNRAARLVPLPLRIRFVQKQKEKLIKEKTH